MSWNLAFSLSPRPASIIIVRAPRTMRGRIAMVMRLRSSAIARRLHSGFGTVPNIAPPSRWMNPSQSEISSRLPSLYCCTCDSSAMADGARLIVDQPRAPRLELRDRRIDVVHTKRDVMDARAALLDVLRDRRLGRCGLQQLELRFADRHEMRAHVLRRHVFGWLHVEPERVPVKRERRSEIFHGDADVVEDGLHINCNTRSVPR